MSFLADNAAVVYDRIADVQLQHDCVHIVNIDSSCWTDTVFSVCSKPCNSISSQACAKHGTARTIVGATSSGVLTCRNAQCCRQAGLRVKCQHCKAVASWMQSIRHDIYTSGEEGHAPDNLDMLIALAAGFEGLMLQADVSQTQPDSSAAVCANLPISKYRIDPDSRHPVMRKRAQHGYGRLAEHSHSLHSMCIQCCSSCRRHAAKMPSLSTGCFSCQMPALHSSYARYAKSHVHYLLYCQLGCW